MNEKNGITFPTTSANFNEGGKKEFIHSLEIIRQNGRVREER
jgi:hypothetical protein